MRAQAFVHAQTSPPQGDLIMPLVANVTAILTGAVNANVLTGSIFEYAPFNAIAYYYLVGDAAGELRCTVTHGARTIMEESPVSRANRQPVVPDDFTMSGAVRAGERIVVKARNTGAGTNTLFWRCELKPR